MSQAIIWKNTAVHRSVTISKSGELLLDRDSQEYYLVLMSINQSVLKLKNPQKMPRLNKS